KVSGSASPSSIGAPSSTCMRTPSACAVSIVAATAPRCSSGFGPSACSTIVGAAGSAAPLELSPEDIEPGSLELDVSPVASLGAGASDVEPAALVVVDALGGASYEVKPAAPGAVQAATPRAATIEALE